MTLRGTLGLALRATVIAAVGPVSLLQRSLGDTDAADLFLLMGAMFTVALILSILIAPPRASSDGRRRTQALLWITGAMTLPFVLSSETAAAVGASAAPRIRTTLLSMAVLGIPISIGIWRRRDLIAVATDVLVITSAVVVSVTLSVIARAEVVSRAAIRSSRTLTALTNWRADLAAVGARRADRPDIVLVLLDAYAGDSLLRADYGVDHSWFADSLSKLEVQSLRPYHSNYTRTFASVASLLNFSHVANVSGEALVESQHANALHSIISNARATRLLKALGYDIEWFPAPLFAGWSNVPRHASVHRLGGNAIARRYWSSLLIRSWLEDLFVPGVVLTTVFGHSSVTESYFDWIGTVSAPSIDRRPSFAFVHLFSTHEPLQFAESCAVDAKAPTRLGVRRAYAAAVRCTDHALLRLFGLVRAMQNDNTVVIAVGDHAPSAVHYDESAADATEVPMNVRLGRFSVPALVYLPARYRPGFTAPTSGVNLLPAILNATIGTQLPYSEDDMYYSQPKPFRIHRFLRVVSDRPAIRPVPASP